LLDFHGNSPFVNDIPLPSFAFASDACLSGGAAHFDDDWFYTSWKWDHPEVLGSHINIFELKTVLESAKRWGPRWAGLHIQVRSDNTATVAAINKGTSRSEDLLSFVHELFWLSVKFNFKLSARHISGQCNVLADRLSRLDSVSEAHDARLILTNFTQDIVSCKSHMTPISFIYLQDCWNHVCRSSKLK
jgi:hypothetical protein